MTESESGRAGAPLRAPTLSVRGLGPGEVTIADLTAGGCTLLLFVSEECPTSAMALRRLGPLCRALAGGRAHHHRCDRSEQRLTPWYRLPPDAGSTGVWHQGR